ncbi:hypothetical protein [Lawsonibacter sp. JLR.KK007]|uniref:hypothetical protein n=1 Tax=Lawsonibacter sp. JLR.KK007 TaxID=3114293 RepID=UPI002FF0ACF3
MSQVVLDLMNSTGKKSGKDGSLQRVLSHPRVHRSVDRCQVFPLLSFNCLMAILERMTVIGEAPEGGLSGLAMAVLRAWFICLHARGDLESQCRQMLESPKAAAILAAEDPKMVQAYLKWRAEMGSIRCLEALLELGADPNGLDCTTGGNWLSRVDGIGMFPVAPLDCAHVAEQEECCLLLELYGGVTVQRLCGRKESKMPRSDLRAMMNNGEELV